MAVYEETGSSIGEDGKKRTGGVTKRRELLQVVGVRVSIRVRVRVTVRVRVRVRVRRVTKRRELLQVVSPASPTYLHNLALSPDEIAYRTPPPYVAVGS